MTKAADQCRITIGPYEGKEFIEIARGRAEYCEKMRRCD